jgi:hypothetical protein
MTHLSNFRGIHFSPVILHFDAILTGRRVVSDLGVFKINNPEVRLL